MIENFIFAILLIILNLVFVFKPIPIVAIPLIIFTFLMCFAYFPTDMNLPYNNPNPIFSIFIALFGITCLFRQILQLKGK